MGMGMGMSMEEDGWVIDGMAGERMGVGIDGGCGHEWWPW